MVDYDNFVLIIARKCMHLLSAELMIGTALILSNSNNYSEQIYSVECSIAKISISTNGYLSKILCGREHKMAVLAAFFVMNYVVRNEVCMLMEKQERYIPFQLKCTSQSPGVLKNLKLWDVLAGPQ